MRYRVGARTDVGRVRSGNEDGFVVDDPVFAVADGMGGHRGGEVASKTALETLRKVTDGGDLAETVREANRAVFEKASGDASLAGMGTTLTAVLAEGERFRLAHIGDSRAYILHDGELRRITKDHTIVERLVDEGRLTPKEAEIHPQRSILTRALGVEEDVQVDEEMVDVQPGDRLLLCSDGLTGMVEEDVILSILSNHEDPQAASDALIEAANEAGGQDNITALVIDVVGDDGAAAENAATVEEKPTAAPTEGRDFAAGPVGAARLGGRRWPGVALRVLVLVAVVGGGLWAAKAFWIDRQYYVGEANGRVALYRGIPAAPLGVELFTVVEETGLLASDVTAFPEYRDLEEGITAESEDAAREIIAQMQLDLEAQARDEQPGP